MVIAVYVDVEHKESIVIVTYNQKTKAIAALEEHKNTNDVKIFVIGD